MPGIVPPPGRLDLKAPLASPTGTGVATWPTLAASGNGAGGFTNPGRFLGVRTSAGPPTSGTFTAGDWGLDSEGRMWSCTVGGTPGTWIDLSSGRELGYAERTTDATFTSTTAAAITGLSTSVTVGSRPIEIEVWVPDVLHSSATQYVGLYIFEDGIAIAQAFAVPGTVANPLSVKRRRTPSAGSHTYAAYAAAQSATGTLKMGTGAVGAYPPGFVRVVEC